MPAIVTKAVASAQGYGFSLGGKKAVYVEDVFSTYLYTGNGSTQTITNNIDLSTKGGLVWTKCRSNAYDNSLTDTVTGANKQLYSNLTNSQGSFTNNLTGFLSSGYTLGNDSSAGTVNNNTYTYASWTFRKQPKFFDVVTYTGNGTAGRTVAHNLGATPGMIIVKRTDSPGSWAVYHKSLPSASYFLNLNYTDAQDVSSTVWNDTAPTSTVFSVGTASGVNGSGGTFVAYLFADQAGGFGAAGADSVVACGSFTTDGSGNATVSLGWEPQFAILKKSSGTSNWLTFDNMRGLPAATSIAAAVLKPNTSDAETNDGSQGYINPTATGFTAGGFASSVTYIYLAIRRGPMKTPTDATKVYAPITFAGNSTSDTQITSGFVTDWFFDMQRNGGDYWNVFDRLRGYNPRLLFQTTNAEDTPAAYYSKFDNMTGVLIGSGTGMNGSGKNYSAQMFRRAPGFFDEVCYTGAGSAQNVNHNLGVAPQLMIVKNRVNTGGWLVYNQTIGVTNYLYLDKTDASATFNVWNNTTPTSTVFSLASDAGSQYNRSGDAYVAYLFATCAGVSKVGSYTGTGAAQNIDCGFSSSARFILIKRTDSTGDWWVYDSARGISASNDPYLFLNSTAAEVTNTDYVNTYATGFSLTSSAPAGLNANGGSYIFLAVA